MRDEQFERLYTEHAPALFAFLAYRTGDRSLAEDLLADTFERALRARARYDPRRAKQKTWLYAIALNLVRDGARRRAAEGRAIERVSAGAASHDEDPGEVIAGRDFAARAMRVLSDAEREAIALRFGADLTAPEIARLTGESLTTIEGRIYRALRKMREGEGA